MPAELAGGFGHERRDEGPGMRMVDTSRRHSGVAARVLVLLCMGLMLVGLAGPAQAQALSEPDPVAGWGTDDAARVLAEKYAPVMRLVKQPEQCSRTGEPYGPMSVESLMGNRQIALRQYGTDDPVMMWGPDASDLFGLGEGFYLDFPGSGLDPGCIYEQDYRRFTAQSGPTVYAHVVTQRDRPDQLVVQYWFYWYFNDWNNTHESDWEGIQLVFDAASPSEALGLEPSEVGYAQHEGGERASWDASKLSIVDGRPVVYSSAGSHASYFESRLHLGRGASEGFGCDTTEGPSVEITPSAVLLPSAVNDPDDEFAWLGFEGRWGELHDGPFAGPTGPQHKERWSHPMDWQDTLRDESASLPSAGTRAGGLVTAFCNVVEAGSNQLMASLRSPARTAVVVSALVLSIGWLIRRTEWNRTLALPLIARRRYGQVVLTSFEAFKSAPHLFLMVSLVALPLGAVLGLVSSRLSSVAGLGALFGENANGDTSQILLVAMTGALASSLSFTVVTAAVASVLDDLSVGNVPTPRSVMSQLLRHLPELLVAFAVAAVVVLALSTSFFLLPIALYFLVKFLFIPQVTILEPKRNVWGILRRSAQITRGRWWHSAMTMALVLGGTKVLTAVLGLIVLVTLQPPFWLLSTITVAIDAMLMPLAGITANYVYGDAEAEARGAGAAGPTQQLLRSQPLAAPAPSAES